MQADNDNIFSKKGMAWTIAVFVKIALLSGCFEFEFNSLFSESFKLHFSYESDNISISREAKTIQDNSNDLYYYIEKYIK